MSKARNMARMGQDTSAGYTGAFDMPAGTTAERPASAGLGWTRLNTDTGSVEVYDGTNWNSVTRPFISSVTGTIYAGATSNLVIAGQNFTSTITVRFLEGGSTVADVAGVTVTAGSATVAVPAAVYGQTAGDSIEVKIINVDGTVSANGITKIVQALPTGGTITTSGSYRIHTFTSSSNFVVPSGFSATAEYLVVAGGGSGGGGTYNSGGGGAGGMLTGSTSISPQTYSVVVGGGGAGTVNHGANGSASSALGISTIGGGGGGQHPGGDQAGYSGGSGGGGSQATGAPGAGTAGQGNTGGGYWYAAGAGGGGAGAGAAIGPGGTTVATQAQISGGAGAQSSISGSAVYYAGGGGGGARTGYGLAQGLGGIGGGGNGGTDPSNGFPATANTGGGGGGSGGDNTSTRSGGNGGSGIVIIRYQLA